MSGNHDDLTKILNLTKIMSLKIAQLSDESKITTQLKNLENLNRDYETIICEYSEQAAAPLEKKILDLEQELQDYRNKFDSNAKKTIEKLINEKKELEKNLELASEDLIQANNKISEQNEKINQLTIENQQMNNKLHGEWKCTQDIRKALQQERIMREDLKGRISELKRTLRRLNRRLSRGGRLFGIHIPVERIEEDEIEATDNNKEKFAQMKFELQKRLDKITELEMKNRELKNQIMKSPKKDLELQIQNLNKELDSRKGKISTFESERKKLEAQISALQNRITDLQVNFQEQSKIISDRDKRIKDLENTMRLGIHEKKTRDLVVDLQEKNKKLQYELRQKETDIKNLDKNAFFYKQQLDVLKQQVSTLYAKNRELVSKIQHGGTISAADLRKDVELFDGSSSFDKEMKDQKHKLHRLEEMTKNLEQETADLRFALHSKDAKIDQLAQMMSELKIILAKAKIQVGPKAKKKKS
ncbi:MAG: hypothetical protein ACTSRG_04655 [Candidatus Helarchaeota archaeon]